MNIEIIIVAIIASLPGIWAVIQNSKKARAEVRLVDAQARTEEAEENNIRVDINGKYIKTLQEELGKQKKELADIRSRLALAESRATIAESRISDYERISNNARGDIVKLGEELSKERQENQDNINKIATLVSRLIEQVRRLGATPEISVEESSFLDKLVLIGT